jgi:hypothetical protein
MHLDVTGRATNKANRAQLRRDRPQVAFLGRPTSAFYCQNYPAMRDQFDAAAWKDTR